MTDTLKIEQKITSVSTVTTVLTDKVDVSSLAEKTLVEICVNEKMKRPEILEGRTYKIKTPLSDSALYLVINDIVLNVGTEFETRRPFEIFINSKEMENYQWIVAFTRLISAIFRKGGDVTFIIEELKSVFDPNGGYFTKRGRIPSLVAEIGYTLEEHFKYIGLIKTEVDVHVQEFVAKKKADFLEQGGSIKNAKECMKCHAIAVIVLDNCPTCLECGDSHCG